MKMETQSYSNEKHHQISQIPTKGGLGRRRINCESIRSAWLRQTPLKPTASNKQIRTNKKAPQISNFLILHHCARAAPVTACHTSFRYLEDHCRLPSHNSHFFKNLSPYPSKRRSEALRK